MEAFAERTGLVSGGPQRRYLWTDAFAVCNLLALADVSRQPHYRDLALRLVGHVHRTLGRHRTDDRRRGWISGLTGDAAASHPTLGGLRIGKELPERSVDDPLDERLEWERDGQYFHYLTRWMHALDQTARATGEPIYNLWARELAQTAYRAFSYRPFGAAGPVRLYWKMSIDLSRPLVLSMGQHDALDGYITVLQLQSTAQQLPEADREPRLSEALDGFAAMLGRGEWASSDPLGIGGLLVDAWRVAQLNTLGATSDRAPLNRLLEAALAGLRVYAHSDELQRPADQRLAFRELGLAIGLLAAQRLSQLAASQPRRAGLDAVARERLQAVQRYQDLGTQILSFWAEPSSRSGTGWDAHRDINEVMLATALQPDGYLDLRPLQ
jgi:hypothetical protein